ncbi:hypothetical protein [Rhodopseudomonas palustris]|uniref:Uncharacterized protein n=1 Tax=Rhodopseudomonas palustris TaxID=1076 RepID=A0A418VNS1_RHOPL|nr:hypothetical protein [Rhodopseudomonas palustris]RJF77799.1 hypothetical protein D4Q52_02520 [Rhodopseudomonas palustris]
MLFVSIAIWASLSFWLMSIQYTSQLTWVVALALGAGLFALVVRRLTGELRAFRESRNHPRPW